MPKSKITIEQFQQAVRSIKQYVDTSDNAIYDSINELLNPYREQLVIADVTHDPNSDVLEKGEVLLINKVNVEVVKQSEPIVSIKFYKGEDIVYTITDGVADGGKFEFVPEVPYEFVADVPKDHLKVEVEDAGGTVVVGDTAEFSFVYPYYYGTMETDVELTEEIIKGLNKEVICKADEKEVKYTTDGSCAVIAYPKEYGPLKVIYENNGLNATNTFTLNELDIQCLDGTTQTYYVYVSGASSVTDFKYTFKM